MSESNVRVVEPIELDEVRSLLSAGGAVALEVLPRRYYDEGHLPGALQLTLAELDTRAPELIPDLETVVVAYCSGPGCSNSHQAGVALARLGYRQVRVFAGGKAAWRDAGLPLVSEVARA